MKHTYASLGASSVCSKKPKHKLGFGDAIWVIEGDTASSRRFRLVDCFLYSSCEDPPFCAPYSDFKFRALGNGSLLPGSMLLDKADGWFSHLQKRYITKQKFFNVLENEPQIIAGL